MNVTPLNAVCTPIGPNLAKDSLGLRFKQVIGSNPSQRLWFPNFEGHAEMRRVEIHGAVFSLIGKRHPEAVWTDA